jgi:hypothetical protein
MKTSPSMVRKILTGAALFISLPALAAGEVPVDAKLDVRKPAVEIRSWDGRDRGPIPQRRIDPMGIRVGNAHPGTKLELLRQKRSKTAELKGCIGGLCEIEEAAHKATVWTPVAELETENASAVAPATAVSHDAKVIMRPNSRYKVVGRTRDGQELPHVTGIVEGLPLQTEQHYTWASNQMHRVELSGAFLPSARAWIHEGNLFVSEPVKNEKALREGKEMIAQADEKQALITKNQAEMTELRNAWGVQANQIKYNELNRENTQLTADINKLRPEGAKLVQLGEKVMVNVISAGAMPVSANVRTTNIRLQGEQPQATHTAEGVTGADNGFIVQPVEALRQDELRTMVYFPPVPGQKVGSSRSVTYRVPTHEEKAAFEMDGVRFYRVKPHAEQQVNEAPVP